MLPSELKLTSLGHCYVHLPETFVSREPAIKGGAIVSIKSIQNDYEVYAMWNGQLTAGEHLELDLKFAQANKLQAELVIINSIDNLELAECTFCCAELVDSSDYAILSEHTDLNLLETCRLICKDLVIPILISQHISVMVKIVSFQPDKSFGLLNKWTEMSFHHNIDNLTKTEQPLERNHGQMQNDIPFLSTSLGISHQRPPFYFGSMLVCGDRGSGKTYKLKGIMKDYKQVHSEYIDCHQFRGKRPETVKKKFSEILAIAAEKQQSIIVLDDIDSFLEHDSKHQDHGQDVLYKRRLVDAIQHLIEQLHNVDKGSVVLLASCRSLDTLDKLISNPKGCNYFNEIIKIPAPDLMTRIEIFQNLIQERKQIRSSLDNNQLFKVSQKCNSLMPTDLRCIFERALLSACSRSILEFNSEPVTLELDDFMKSLAGYTPFNLRAIPLQPKTKLVNFDQVGGMASIRENLVKTVLLPIKYPKLYKKCPLKRQNSILLYGPPGCGKTLLAKALINEEGLNSICVRGPELFSKYIGASEAAVRDLFKRAEQARPCVIFFDEFESLVARRGTDSTGVTDRVVNQFLTVLDGVERLSHDVFIIAATSQPDMIDPAMLRPGRMDKHIYCPLPNVDDRLDIITVLSKDMDFEKEVDFTYWSRTLSGFTGADIKGFLYSAQLKSLHEAIDVSENAITEKLHGGRRPKNDIDMVISNRHLEEAFNEMRGDVDAKLKYLLNKHPSTINQVQKNRVAMRTTLA